MGDRERELGKLSWVITEEATGRVLGEGSQAVRLKDVSFEESATPQGPLVQKSIRLTTPFRLNLPEFPGEPPGECDGFGVTAKREDVQTFCWEWFTVNQPGHATKLQESGELAIRRGQTGAGWELVRTEFLTDVSLRVIRMDAAADPRKPEWRVKILKGSSIEWPSQVNGEILPNP